MLKPAIGYAFDGQPVPEIIARSWKGEIESRSKDPENCRGLLDTYAPGGKYPGKGDVWRNPALGETLASHEGAWIDPVSKNYRGWDIWELPPNGQGIAEGYDIANFGFGSAKHLQAFIEAKKLAY